MRFWLDYAPVVVGFLFCAIMALGLRREASADQAYRRGLEQGRDEAVGRLERTLRQSRRVEMEVWRRVMSVLDDLRAKVASIQSTEESAVALINGLREQLKGLVVANDGLVPAAKVQELIASLDASSRSLAAAVTENIATGALPPQPSEDAPEEKPAEDPRRR